MAKDVHLVQELGQIIEVHIRNSALPSLKESMLKLNPCALEDGCSIEDAPPEVVEAWRKDMIAHGKDPYEKPTEEVTRNSEKLNIRMIHPAEQKDFLPTHNALHCGSLSLKLMSLIEEAGVALANHHRSIFCTAHLYNALKQLEITEAVWPEMENIIDLHCKSIFANDIPKTPDDIFRRFAYRTGLSRFSKNFNKNETRKMRASTASKSLKQLFENKGRVEDALLQLEDQVSEHITQPERPQRKGPGRRQRRLQPLQLLQNFEKYLPIVIKDMQIDYINLTRSCNRLMRQIRQKAESELGEEYPTMGSAENSHEHVCMCVLVLLLDQNAKAHSVHVRRKIREPFRGSEEMQLAARTFEEFFAQEKEDGMISD